MDYIFKIADSEWEYDKIFELNYQTFVEEIPQHSKNLHKKLVDKFHSENTYIICIAGRMILGMLAFRAKRPFSLDYKFEAINKNVDDFIPRANNICEVRLLSIDKKYRHTSVFNRLMKKTINYAKSESFDLALISGIISQQKLYQKFGFTPFGPVVGNPPALYQPMFLDIKTFKEKMIPQFNNGNENVE